jgi:deoxyribonuclease IV
MKTGSHVGYCGDMSLYDHILKCVQSDMTCCQFFNGNPQKAYDRKEHKLKDLELSATLCEELKFKPYTHFPYSCNLVKPLNNDALKSLQGEIDIMNQLGGSVVIHPNSPAVKGGPTNKQNGHPDYIPQYTKAITTMTNNLKKLKFVHPYTLLLEPPAGEGQKIGWSFDQMALIAKQLKENNLDVGFCIDTCHAFGAGLSKFDTVEATQKFFNELDNIGVLKLVKCIHLNDSVCPFGSMKDQHAFVSKGLIWSHGLEGLVELIKICKEHKIDIICETDCCVDGELFVLSLVQKITQLL